MAIKLFKINRRHSVLGIINQKYFLKENIKKV